MGYLAYVFINDRNGFIRGKTEVSFLLIPSLFLVLAPRL